jgi:hypothetical protein
MKQVYRSKVDSWLLILILVAWGIPLTLIVVNEFSAVKFSIVSFMLIFTLLLLFGIKYTIEGKVLRVHYSFFYSERINIDEITEIANTHTLLSAPAASLDRVKITYGKKYVILSPKDKQMFVKQLCDMSANQIRVNI